MLIAVLRGESRVELPAPAPPEALSWRQPQRGVITAQAQWGLAFPDGVLCAFGRWQSTLLPYSTLLLGLQNGSGCLRFLFPGSM